MIILMVVLLLLGFEKPSAIQQRAIKQIIKGRDVIAQYVWSRANTRVLVIVMYVD